MHELEEYYSFDDMLDLLECLTVARANERIAYKHSEQQNKRR